MDYWNPLSPKYAPSPLGRLINQNTYEDSVAPIVEAGPATVWDGTTHRIDENLVLESMPGHTTGSAILSLESGGDRAFFIGDLCHSPFQTITPDCGSCFDEDAAATARSRRKLLNRAAETKALIFAAHFSGGEPVEVTKRGDGFAFAGWTPFRS